MIPVVIVDDGEADRYLVKRRMMKSEDFGELIEISSGDLFLKAFYSDNSQAYSAEEPLLVLMDINMPGRDGFQTIEEIRSRIAEGRGPASIIILMYTSSLNEHDQERAQQIGLVKGYLPKPIRKETMDYIRQVYRSHCAS